MSWRRVSLTVLLLNSLVLAVAQDAAHAGGRRCFGEVPTIVGTNGRDEIRGTNGIDVILAKGGNDFVNSDRGADLICGGRGRDNLLGETQTGHDQISGGAGGDKLKGAAHLTHCLAGRARTCCAASG